MTRTIRELNDTICHLDNEVNSCSERISALESTREELIRQNIILQNKYQNLLLDHQKTQNIQKNPKKDLIPKHSLKKLFDHTPARQLTNIQ